MPKNLQERGLVCDALRGRSAGGRISLVWVGLGEVVVDVRVSCATRAGNELVVFRRLRLDERESTRGELGEGCPTRGGRSAATGACEQSLVSFIPLAIRVISRFARNLQDDSVQPIGTVPRSCEAHHPLLPFAADQPLRIHCTLSPSDMTNETVCFGDEASSLMLRGTWFSATLSFSALTRAMAAGLKVGAALESTARLKAWSLAMTPVVPCTVAAWTHPHSGSSPPPHPCWSRVSFESCRQR